MVKPTSVLYGILIGGLFVTVMALLFGNIQANYVTKGYNTTDTIVFDKINDTYAVAQKLNNNVVNASVDRSLTDLVGGLIIDSIYSLKLTLSSFDTFRVMIEAGTTTLGLPFQFRTVLIAVFLVAITAFFISIKVGREV